MVVSQQKFISDAASRSNFIHLLNLLKLRNLSERIDSEEVNRLRNNTVSSRENNTDQLHRSKRGIGNVFILMHRLYEISKKVGWKKTYQIAKRYFSQPRGQEKALETAKDILDEVNTLADILERFLPSETSEERVTQVSPITEIPQITEDYSNISLHLAAEQGNLIAVKYFIEKGGDISAQDEMGFTPLHLAAKKGNLDIVKYLIKKGADVDVYQGGWSYSTPLHLAAQNGYLETVKYLIEKGANPKATDSDGKTPMQRAKENGHSDVVAYLTEREHQVTGMLTTTKESQLTNEQQLIANEQNVTEQQQITKEKQQITEVSPVIQDYSNTTLHLAAFEGKLDIVKYFVEEGANLNLKEFGDRGDTPLHYAAEGGHLNVVRYLVEKGADLEAKGFYDQTPLYSAIQNGNLDVVKYLVEKGANLNHPQFPDWTPLHSAACYGHSDVAQYFIDEGIDINSKSANGLTPLHCAAEKNYLEMVKFLAEKGADLMIEDARGKTPLHKALCISHIVAYLVEKGVDLNAKDKKGMTPLHEAVQCSSYDSLDTIKYLVDSGADLNSKDNKGQTPLHYAVGDMYRSLRAVKCLVSGGADINAVNNDGKTPLHIAVETTVNSDIVKYLVKNGADLNVRDNNNETPLDLDIPLSSIENFLFRESVNQLHQRSRRNISRSSWKNSNVVNWVKGLISRTQPTTLLTSKKLDNTTVTAMTEINTTAIVNNTVILGILAVGLFNKTKYKQPIHENLLSPREQLMRNVDASNSLLEQSLQKGIEERWG